MLFIFSLMSVPAYIFFYSGNSADEGTQTNLKYTLAALSLGNIGQSDYACNSAQMSQSKISLYCAYGTLDSVSMFGQTFSNSSSSCSDEGSSITFSPKYCSYESSNFGATNKNYVDKVFNQSCSGKVSCDFPLNSTLVPLNCTTGASPKINTTEVVYFLQAICKSDTIKVFQSDSMQLSKFKVAMIVVILDLSIALIFLFSMIYLRAFQNITAHEIDESVITASDFAVQIRNIPEHDNLK